MARPQLLNPPKSDGQVAGRIGPQTQQFAMLTRGVLGSATWSRLSKTDSDVYLAILMHADPKGIAWPSVARIARLIHKSERQVKRSIARLVIRDLIQRVKPGGRGHSTKYQVSFGQPDPPIKGDNPDTVCQIERVTKQTLKGDKSGPERVTELSPQHHIEQTKKEQQQQQHTKVKTETDDQTDLNADAAADCSVHKVGEDGKKTDVCSALVKAGVKPQCLPDGVTLDGLAEKVGTVERLERYLYTAEKRASRNPIALMVKMILDGDDPPKTPGEQELAQSFRFDMEAIENGLVSEYAEKWQYEVNKILNGLTSPQFTACHENICRHYGDIVHGRDPKTDLEVRLLMALNFKGKTAAYLAEFRDRADSHLSRVEACPWKYDNVGIRCG